MEVLGKKHPKYLFKENNAANCLLEKGQYDDADAIYRKAEDVKLKVVGERHFNISWSKPII